MEDLVALDEVARRLIGTRQETVSFRVRGGPRGALVFGSGACRFVRGAARSTISLYFPSAAAFNAMVAGKGNPIPLKGFFRLGFLKGTFTQLGSRLETVLKASGNELDDSHLRRTQAELLLYTVGFALCEVGNHDPSGKHNAARIPDGIIEIGVKGGPAVSITARGGHLEAVKGRSGHARAQMVFASMEDARRLFTGEIDAMVALGEGLVELRGFIPMIEHMSKILGLVPRYLR
jgi:hypothetical protein